MGNGEEGRKGAKTPQHREAEGNEGYFRWLSALNCDFRFLISPYYSLFSVSTVLSSGVLIHVADNLTDKTYRRNQTITYTYDQLKRLTGKTYPDTTARELHGRSCPEDFL